MTVRVAAGATAAASGAGALDVSGLEAVGARCDDDVHRETLERPGVLRRRGSPASHPIGGSPSGSGWRAARRASARDPALRRRGGHAGRDAAAGSAAGRYFGAGVAPHAEARGRRGRHRTEQARRLPPCRGRPATDTRPRARAAHPAAATLLNLPWLRAARAATSDRRQFLTLPRGRQARDDPLRRTRGGALRATGPADPHGRRVSTSTTSRARGNAEPHGFRRLRSRQEPQPSFEPFARRYHARAPSPTAVARRAGTRRRPTRRTVRDAAAPFGTRPNGVRHGP